MRQALHNNTPVDRSVSIILLSARISASSAYLVSTAAGADLVALEVKGDIRLAVGHLRGNLNLV